MKKTFTLITVLLMLLGAFTFAAPLSAQDEARWDGADDLPVNPLDCPMAEGEAAPAETEEAPMEAPAYDGGQPTDAPDLAGQDIVLVDVPKLIGIGYFAATTQGLPGPTIFTHFRTVCVP